MHEWTCPNCGIHHDRDVNAGLNLKEERDRESGPMSEWETEMYLVSAARHRCV
ncbi:MAG: zinc ribbon domain-containing protein [Exiguobacterium marinum]|uniref:zinc ribbon domain-containing protein n=1 Tax=Exiguobacterium marinum TaxID=273528 RepID=UPI003C658482